MTVASSIVMLGIGSGVSTIVATPWLSAMVAFDRAAQVQVERLVVLVEQVADDEHGHGLRGCAGAKTRTPLVAT